MATFENDEGEEDDEEEKQVTEIPLVPQSLIKSNPSNHNHNYIVPCEPGSSSTMISIFPPINHENLRPEPPDQAQSLPDQDSEVSVSASPGLGAELVVNEVPGAWWESGISYLWCKVYPVFSSFRDRSSGFWSRGVIVGAAAMLALWYMRVQKQRRRRIIMDKESRDHLIRVIKEKDEKISTLLRQVAQMNEILLGLYTTKGRSTT